MKKTLFLLIIFSFWAPSEIGAAVETLRPNGVGSETVLNYAMDPNGVYIGGNLHWGAVDDVFPDGFNSFVGSTDSTKWLRDLYSLTNHSQGTGVITGVTVYVVDIGSDGSFKPSLRTGGRTFDGNMFAGASEWLVHSYKWILNPATTVRWTWNDIDALEIGTSIKYTPAYGSFGEVTQVYAEVEYNPSPCQEHNVSGWAWSKMDDPVTPAIDEGQIGWMSFSCKNCDAIPNPTGCPADNPLYNYGVDINQNGNFSGYAWSENIGWINFAPVGPYPASPNYPACLDLPGSGQACDGIGNYNVGGWARALAYGGGWDGWVKLRGTNYGVSIDKDTGDFSGYAWSDAIIGWIHFAGANYKVRTAFTFNSPPNKPAKVGDGETWDNCAWGKTPQVADGTAITFSWTYSDPDGDPQTAYEIEVDDNSSFDAPKFNNLVDLASTSYTLDLSQDDTPDWRSALAWNATYFWRVRVKDNQGNWSEWSSSDEFKMPPRAYPNPEFSWSPLEPTQGESAIFTPEASGFSYLWAITQGEGTFEEGTGPTNQFPYIKFSTPDNKVKLRITDSSPPLPARSCEKEKEPEVQLPLPEYQEIPPIIWLKKIFGGLIAFLDRF